MINKDDFFKKIKEAEIYYYRNNPCYHCKPGNGCDDCRDCTDSKISYEMWKKIYNLKKEYKEKFGVDYDKEGEETVELHRNTSRKQQLLKDVWEQYTFDEIIDAGFEYNKCSGGQLINAAAKFEYNEDNDKSKEQVFIDRIKELFDETDTKDLPYGRNMMEILRNYYDTGELLDYFDKDDMIDHLDGSWEMDMYIKDERDKAVEEYKDEMSEIYVPYTKKDFQNEVEEMNNYDFKRFLCDITRNSYFCDNEKLLNDLKNKI